MSTPSLGPSGCIYIETQYFSSRSVCRALTQRLKERGRSRLDVVLVLNQKAGAVKEEIAVGLRQAEVVAHLKAVARDTGHALGVYYTVPAGRLPRRRFGRQPKHRSTFIHSKLMVVDDRFMTIGSANLTNRSMGIDSELNGSWETGSAGSAVGTAIRRVRVSLLTEHTGLTRLADLVRLARAPGLVAFLDDLVQGGQGRLRAHPSPTPNEAKVLEVIDPQALPFDPEQPDEEIVESPEAQRSLFKMGLSALWDKLASSREPSPSRPPSPPPSSGRVGGSASGTRSRVA